MTLRPWRDRAEAGAPRGVRTRPAMDTVPGVQAFPSAYAPGHLVIFGDDRDGSDREAGGRRQRTGLGNAGRSPASRKARHSSRSPARTSSRCRTRPAMTSPYRWSTPGGCCSTLGAWWSSMRSPSDSRSTRRPAPREESSKVSLKRTLPAPADAGRVAVARGREIGSRRAPRNRPTRVRTGDQSARWCRRGDGERRDDSRARHLGRGHRAHESGAARSGPRPRAVGRPDRHQPARQDQSPRDDQPAWDDEPAWEDESARHDEPVGAAGYADPGSGGLEMVSYVGAAPFRRTSGGRRPVVAIIDTGCGAHRWFDEPRTPGDVIVRRNPVADEGGTRSSAWTTLPPTLRWTETNPARSTATWMGGRDMAPSSAESSIRSPRTPKSSRSGSPTATGPSSSAS